MKISFVRGAYLNNFEGQNYPSEIIGYSSQFPIDAHVPFPVIRLFSLADIQKIPFLTLPVKYLANRTLGDSQILYGLENYISNSDIVHIGDPHYYYSYQAALLRSKGKIKKLVSTWWETIPFNNESTTAKKRMKKFTMKYTDRFICYTEKAKICLIAEGVGETSISLIPLGVDTTLFYPSHKRKSNNFTILFVGRLVEEKGILDLYEAFKKSLITLPNLKLRIIGQGPLGTKLQQSMRKDKMEGKVSIEHTSYKQMPEVYRDADIFCVPSKKTATWEEQYGMVFIEAMASGLSIVSYSTGAIPEIVQNAGLLTSQGDILGLIKIITRLHSDKQLCSKLGTIGRERSEKTFNAHVTMTRIKDLYKHL